MFPYPFSFLSPSDTGLADIDNAYSMQFDGVDSYIFTDPANLTGTLTERNYSFWFKHISFPYGDFQPLFCGYSSNVTHKFRYQAGAGIHDGELIWQLGAGAGANLSSYCHAASEAIDGTGSAPNLLDGNWHHIFIYNPVGVRADIANTQMWVDGEQLSVTPVEGTQTLRGIDEWLTIGGGSSGSSGTKFQITNGYIDEFAYWNGSVLSPSDITSIYDATSSGKTADLSEMSSPPDAWYRLGD